MSDVGDAVNRSQRSGAYAALKYAWSASRYCNLCRGDVARRLYFFQYHPSSCFGRCCYPVVLCHWLYCGTRGC